MKTSQIHGWFNTLSQKRKQIVGFTAITAVFFALMMSTFAPARSSAIVNGEIVDYPWAVAFVYPKVGDVPIEQRTNCSGVLIKPQWVLTAAHCSINNGLSSSMSVVIGRSKLASLQGEVRYISSVKYMANSGTYCNVTDKANLCDLALVKLDKPSYMQDADIADQHVVNQWGAGTEARSYGYGKTSKSAKQSSSYLRRARTDITSLRDNHFTLFAKGATSSVCFIDSGGPLIVSTSQGPKVVGIIRAPLSSASSSTICAPGSTNSYTKVGYRGSFTNSRPYLWIQAAIN